MNKEKWQEDVKIALVKEGITQAELADKLGLSRGYIRALVSGVVYVPGAIRTISEYFGIEPYEE